MHTFDESYFDAGLDRRGTRCEKWDGTEKESVLPLWVADMDFPSPPEVAEAIAVRALHPTYGYTLVLPDDTRALSGFWQRRHNLTIQDEWVMMIPCVVTGIRLALLALTKPGDGVMIQSPVYGPFRFSVEATERRLMDAPLKRDDTGRYSMDLDAVEKQLQAGAKALVLCNPHNPVGRVWTKEELTAIGDLCVQYGVTVVSDEIHGDFIFKGEHQVFTAIKKEYEDITITCTAPSKTFNLASMMMSNIFIANPELRAKFRKQLDAAGTSQLGVMGLVACETAYNKGEEWYEAMLSYVKANAEFTRQYVEEQIPGVKMIDLEGTYLVWLDFRETGLSVDELEDLIINKAKLWLDSGKIFGDCGRGFQRINIACPRATLTEALERIRDAMKSR